MRNLTYAAAFVTCLATGGALQASPATDARDIAQLKTCVHVIRGLDARALSNADLHRGEQSFYTEWSSGVVYLNEAPGIAACKLTKPLASQRDRVAGFSNSQSNLPYQQGLTNECYHAIRDFKARYNQLMAQNSPGALSKNCRSPGKIDRSYKPFDFERYYAEINQTNKMNKLRGLPVVMTAQEPRR